MTRHDTSSLPLAGPNALACSPAVTMSNNAAARFLRFGCVGAVGFLVDAGILSSLMYLGWEPWAARALSFPVAVLATWLLNKAWTFSSQRPREGVGRWLYFGIQVVGALINLGIFTMLISVIPGMRNTPWVSLAMAAVAALAFNYTATRLLVFHHRT